MAGTADSIASTSRPLDEGTRLAILRTVLGAERTLMAWIRTAFSMISFGFTIGKFLGYLHDQESAGNVPENGGWLPRLLVLIGLVSLMVGVVEYRRTRKSLAAELGKTYRASAAGLIALLVGLLGTLAFLSLTALIRDAMPLAMTFIVSSAQR
jgi:putative membrane protein